MTLKKSNKYSYIQGKRTEMHGSRIYDILGVRLPSVTTILAKTKDDHRICMSSVIFSLVTGMRAKIKNFETVNTSFPEFISLIRNLGGKIVIK